MARRLIWFGGRSKWCVYGDRGLELVLIATRGLLQLPGLQKALGAVRTPDLAPSTWIARAIRSALLPGFAREFLEPYDHRPSAAEAL